MTFGDRHTIILLYDNIASLCAGAAVSAPLPKDRRDTVHMEREYKMSAARAQELQEELRVILAKAVCKNVSKEEVHQMVEQIYSEYEE